MQQLQEGRNAGGGPAGIEVILQPPAVMLCPPWGRFEPLTNSACPVAAGPCARQREREVVWSKPVVRGNCEAAGRIHLIGHLLEGDDARPLMTRVPPGTITAFLDMPNRDAAHTLMADVAAVVGKDQIEGGNLPGLGCLAKFCNRVGAIRVQERRQPLTWLGAKPAQRHGSRSPSHGRQDFIDDRSIAARHYPLNDRLSATHFNSFDAFPRLFPLVFEEKTTWMV